MPRKPRLDVSDAFFHVTARGVNKQSIFLDDDDHRSYLVKMKSLLVPMGVRLHAFALMGNHPHLLLQTLKPNLSRFMHRLHNWYAKRFNWKNDRSGPVFRERYLSKRVADDGYLNEVGRYIHKNPVKHGFVSRPELYGPSSIHTYLSGRPDGLVETELLLSFHGGDRRAFYDFTVAGTDIETDELGWPVTGWYADEPTAPAVEAPDVDVELLLDGVASVYGVPRAALAKRWMLQGAGEARAAAMLALRAKTDWMIRDIGAELGVGTPNAVSNRLRWLKERAAESADTRARLESLGLLGYLGVLGV